MALLIVEVSHTLHHTPQLIRWEHMHAAIGLALCQGRHNGIVLSPENTGGPVSETMCQKCHCAFSRYEFAYVTASRPEV